MRTGWIAAALVLTFAGKRRQQIILWESNSIISLDRGSSNLGLSLIVFQSKLIVSVTDRTPEQISQPKSKH